MNPFRPFALVFALVFVLVFAGGASAEMKGGRHAPTVPNPRPVYPGSRFSYGGLRPPRSPGSYRPFYFYPLCDCASGPGFYNRRTGRMEPCSDLSPLRSSMDGVGAVEMRAR